MLNKKFKISAVLFFAVILLSGFTFSHLSVREIVEKAGVSDTDGCLAWALGENYGFLRFQDIDDAWNEKHSNIFVLSEADNLIGSIKAIGEACVEEGF